MDNKKKLKKAKGGGQVFKKILTTMLTFAMVMTTMGISNYLGLGLKAEKAKASEYLSDRPNFSFYEDEPIEIIGLYDKNSNYYADSIYVTGNGISNISMHRTGDFIPHTFTLGAGVLQVGTYTLTCDIEPYTQAVQTGLPAGMLTIKARESSGGGGSSTVVIDNSSSITALNQTIASLNSTIETLRNSISDLTTQTQILTTEKQETQKQLDAKDKSLKEVTDALTKANTEKAELEKSKKELEGQVSDLTKNNDGLTKQLQDKEKELEYNKSLVDQYKAQYEKLCEKVNSLISQDNSGSSGDNTGKADNYYNVENSTLIINTDNGKITYNRTKTKYKYIDKDGIEHEVEKATSLTPNKDGTYDTFYYYIDSDGKIHVLKLNKNGTFDIDEGNSYNGRPATEEEVWKVIIDGTIFDGHKVTTDPKTVTVYPVFDDEGTKRPIHTIDYDLDGDGEKPDYFYIGSDGYIYPVSFGFDSKTGKYSITNKKSKDGNILKIGGKGNEVKYTLVVDETTYTISDTSYTGPDGEPVKEATDKDNNTFYYYIDKDGKIQVVIIKDGKAVDVENDSTGVDGKTGKEDLNIGGKDYGDTTDTKKTYTDQDGVKYKDKNGKEFQIYYYTDKGGNTIYYYVDDDGVHILTKNSDETYTPKTDDEGKEVIYSDDNSATLAALKKQLDEIGATLKQCDNTINSILAKLGKELGINDNELAGKTDEEKLQILSERVDAVLKEKSDDEAKLFLYEQEVKKIYESLQSDSINEKTSASLEEELKKVNSDIASLLASNSKLKTAAESLATQVSNVTSEKTNSELKSEADALKDRISAATKQFDTLNSQIKALQSTAKDYQTIISNAKTLFKMTKDPSAQEVVDTVTALVNKEAEESKTIADIQTALGTDKTGSDLVQTLKDKLAAANNSGNSGNSGSSGTSSTTTTNSTLDATTAAKLAELTAKNEVLNAQLADAKTQNSTLTDKLAALSTAGGSDDTSALTAQNASLLAENANLAEANKGLSASNSKLTSNNKKLTSNNKSLSANNKKLSANNKSLTAQLKAAKKNVKTVTRVQTVRVPDTKVVKVPGKTQVKTITKTEKKYVNQDGTITDEPKSVKGNTDTKKDSSSGSMTITPSQPVQTQSDGSGSIRDQLSQTQTASDGSDSLPSVGGKDNTDADNKDKENPSDKKKDKDNDASPVLPVALITLIIVGGALFILNKKGLINLPFGSSKTASADDDADDDLLDDDGGFDVDDSFEEDLDNESDDNEMVG